MSKFRGLDHFQDSDYRLLPFDFMSIADGKEVLVNIVGDFVVAPTGTAEALVSKKIDQASEAFQDLAARFFVTSGDLLSAVEILATRYRTKRAHLDDFTSLHLLVTTLRCNQSCHYCQVSRQSEDRVAFDMSPEVLQAAVAHIYRSPAPRVTVEFQGGEPLLAFDTLKHAVSQCESLGRQAGKATSFVICTNLSTLDSSHLEYFRDKSILVSTSLDGPPAVHDKNRLWSGGASYEQTIAGINRVRDCLGSDQVSALMTTTRLSLQHPEAIIDSYVENGFSNIFLRDINPYGFANRSQRLNVYSADEYLDFYKRALDHIIRLNLSGTRIVEDFAAIALTKMLSPFTPGYVDLVSPSGIVSATVVYNYDGGVYGSDEGRMLAEEGDQRYRIGSVFDDYDKLFYGAETVALVSEGAVAEANPGCSSCGVREYCGADPVRHYATQGDAVGFRPTSDYCEKNMGILKHLLNLMDESREVESLFRSWVLS